MERWEEKRKNKIKKADLERLVYIMLYSKKYIKKIGVTGNGVLAALVFRDEFGHKVEKPFYPWYNFIVTQKNTGEKEGFFMLHDDNKKTSECQVTKIDNLILPADCIVTAEYQGENFVQTVYSARRNLCKTTEKIDKNHYKIVRTGEIKEYDEKNKGANRMSNLRKTFARLEALIRTNFTENGQNQLFLTLTYAENMTDERRLMRDFDAFRKRLKRFLPDYQLEYIAVAEPQERGAWHLHVMLKTTNKAVLFVDNRDLERLWGLGYTDAQRLKSTDVGRYYVTYFTCIASEEINFEPLPDGEELSVKRLKKTSRLGLYPPNFKFYRCSHGIMRPERQLVNLGEIEGNPAFYKKDQKSYAVTKNGLPLDSDGVELVNVVDKRLYKKYNLFASKT